MNAAMGGYIHMYMYIGHSFIHSLSLAYITRMIGSSPVITQVKTKTNAIAYDNSRTQDKIPSKLINIRPKSPISGKRLMYFSSIF